MTAHSLGVLDWSYNSITADSLRTVISPNKVLEKGVLHNRVSSRKGESEAGIPTPC